MLAPVAARAAAPPSLENLARRNGIASVSVAWIANGEISRVAAAGERVRGEPATPDTLYTVASLTKPVTALTVLKLVESGAWNLDEPLARWYVDPDVADAPEAALLTARHVLTHTSGLPNWRADEPDSRLSFAFAPGSRVRYSSEAFEWLRKAVEAKEGATLDELAARLVFAPAEMHDTAFVLRAGDANRLATPYLADGSPAETRPPSQPNGARGLVTTARDYARFLIWTMRGADLPPGLAQTMLSAQATRGPGRAFGLGWEVLPDLDAGQSAIQHVGAEPGVRTLAIGLPRSGRGIVILTSSDRGRRAYRDLVIRALGKTGREIADRSRGWPD